MGYCFLCDTKLLGEQTRVCSSITPLSNVPYPEKIAELMGEEFVVIVTPSDHVCKQCTSLFTQMDKLEQDLKLVKKSMVSHIQKKYGILPANQPIKTLDIVNGHIKTDELEICQKKVPSGLNIRGGTMNPLSNMSKPQPNNNSSKIKIYKCGFCSFQSKELGHVRFHMRTHMSKKDEAELANQVNPTVIKTLAPQGQDAPQPKKRLFRCQVCSLSFDSRAICLDHIQKAHNNPHLTIAHQEKKTEEIPLEMSRLFQPKMMKTNGNRQVQTNMYVDRSQQAQRNMLVNQSQQVQTSSMYVNRSQQAQTTNMYADKIQPAQTNMFVNQSQQAQTDVYVGQRQAQTNMYVDQNLQAQANMYIDQSQQAQTNMYVDQSQQGDISVMDSFNMLLNGNISCEETKAQQERAQNTVQASVLSVNQIIQNTVNGVNLDMDCGENKTDADDLDLESMLAAIHNDS